MRLTPALLAAASIVGVAGCGSEGSVPPRTADVCAPAPPAATRLGPSWPGRLPPAASVALRVDQAGYPTTCPKQADVLSRGALGGAPFAVRDRGGRVVLRGTVGAFKGPWSQAWPFVYTLDFSALRQPGTYRLSLGASTAPVTVGSGKKLYSQLALSTLDFFTAQRDGPDVVAGPLQRRPSHLLDRTASVYATPSYHATKLARPLRPTGVRLDVSGGWSDAGDYLKFVETSSFTELMMLVALRDYGWDTALRARLGEEARHGLLWLMKMWDQGRNVLYYQVGLGEGNGSSVLGDHDLWRLPQTDDPRGVKPTSASYYVSHRPVFAANRPGERIPANLAGRMAAAFGLCAQDFVASDPAFARTCLRAGQTVYEHADAARPAHRLASTPATFYSDPEARDDLELGAIELFLGTRAVGGAGQLHPRPYFYLPIASRWANAYSSSQLAGADSLNLYDVSALAHSDLVQVLRSSATAAFADRPGVSLVSDPTALVNDMGDELALATRLSAHDPFGLANPATNVDPVPHALGYAIEARLYDSLTRSLTYESPAQRQLQWVLGRNAWGSSFVVGAGSVYPHCLAHEVANLSGSLTGAGAILRGAVVDGPTNRANLRRLGAPDGYRRCPASGQNLFSTFDGPNFAYVDSATSPSTSEPAIDYDGLALLAFVQQGSPRSPLLGPRLQG